MTETHNIHSIWDNIIKKSGFLDILIEELYHEGDERHGDGFTIYLSNVIKNRNKRDRDREYNYDKINEPGTPLTYKQRSNFLLSELRKMNDS